MKDVDGVLAMGAIEDLIYVPIVITLNPPDYEWANKICIALGAHSHEIVRGNAMTGIGHLARLFHCVSDEALGLINEAVNDPSSYVRAAADSTRDDIKAFVK